MQKMRNMFTLTGALAVLATLVPGLASAQNQPPPTREATIQEITVRGTVEAIDVTARTVRVRGQQGNVVTLDVPASATRFNEVKVGDIVSIAYYDRVSIRPKPAGEAAVDRRVDPGTTATPGLLPGGIVASQRVTTVKIDSWDPATRLLGFSTPSGQTYTRRVNETVDASLLKGLKPGDQVDVTRTEAIRFSVERAAAAGAAAPQPVVTVEEGFRNRITFSFLWGPDNQFSGKVFQAGSGLYNDVTPLSFDETSFDDVYGSIGLFKIGVGYRLSPRSEATFNFVLSRSGSEPLQVGTVGTENAALTADLEDYSYWGFEGGQRWYFSRVRFTPFVGYLRGDQPVHEHRRRLLLTRRRLAARARDPGDTGLRRLVGIQLRTNRRCADRDRSDRIPGRNGISLHGRPLGYRFSRQRRSARHQRRKLALVVAAPLGRPDSFLARR